MPLNAVTGPICRAGLLAACCCLTTNTRSYMATTTFFWAACPPSHHHQNCCPRRRRRRYTSLTANYPHYLNCQSGRPHLAITAVWTWPLVAIKWHTLRANAFVCRPESEIYAILDTSCVAQLSSSRPPQLCINIYSILMSLLSQRQDSEYGIKRVP